MLDYLRLNVWELVAYFKVKYGDIVKCVVMRASEVKCVGGVGI